MNTQKIEACFGAAKKLIFDDIKQEIKAPNVIALVFHDFDIQTFKVAAYLKAIADIHEVVLLLDTYMEGLARISIINKVMETIYTSVFYPCSHEQYEKFKSNKDQTGKLIFTFYEENESHEGLLMLENEVPFFLYLNCYIQLQPFHKWKAG